MKLMKRNFYTTCQHCEQKPAELEISYIGVIWTPVCQECADKHEKEIDDLTAEDFAPRFIPIDDE